MSMSECGGYRTRHLAWADDENRKISIDSRPVHTYTMTNEISYIEPKARVY